MHRWAWVNMAAGWLLVAPSLTAIAQQAADSSDEAERAAPALPRFLRPHERPVEPRGFGVLADDSEPEDSDEPAPRPNVRAANAAATARARQFITFGDDRFREQKYLLAYQRYKKAAQAAPDLADAHLRQAIAQIALGHYPAAAEAVKRALAVQPRWAEGDFDLGQLYGDNLLAKTDHLERLADAASNDLSSADLMLLVGMQLFFGGQPARARLFFERAVDLGEDPGLLRGFLQPAAQPAHHEVVDL